MVKSSLVLETFNDTLCHGTEFVNLFEYYPRDLCKISICLNVQTFKMFPKSGFKNANLQVATFFWFPHPPCLFLVAETVLETRFDFVH